MINRLSFRKGELTTQQIVMIIVLIASFIIILFFIYRLNLGKLTDSEICHNSVALRSSTLKITSIDCKMNYLCISEGEDCVNFKASTKIKVDSKKKEESYKAIADELVDCWWMFGEGTINFAKFFDFKGMHCALCSSIKFGESINGLTYSGLYSYMDSTKKDSEQTYLKYLYDSNNLSEFYNKFPSLKKSSSEDNLILSEKYFVLTGRDPVLVGDDIIFKAHFIPSKDISKTNCSVFDITRL